MAVIGRSETINQSSFRGTSSFNQQFVSKDEMKMLLPNLSTKRKKKINVCSRYMFSIGENKEEEECFESDGNVFDYCNMIQKKNPNFNTTIVLPFHFMFPCIIIVILITCFYYDCWTEIHTISLENIPTP